MEEKIMTINEVAEYLKISRGTVYNLMEKGDLPFFKVSNLTRFKMSDVIQYVERQSNAQAKSKGK